MVERSALVSAHPQSALPGYPLIDILVFGADLKIDLTPYPPDVRAQIEQHRRRFEAYESKRRQPTGSSELMMVFVARVRYERRLVAVSTSPNADALAMAYVTDLGPCYEWEGSSDCPEREAVFAARYQAAHPSGPFSEYLPLLEAHRWLCAAEGYESEKVPAEAARSRNSYGKVLAVARQSASLLMRTAAEPRSLGQQAKRSGEA